MNSCRGVAGPVQSQQTPTISTTTTTTTPSECAPLRASWHVPASGVLAQLGSSKESAINIEPQNLTDAAHVLTVNLAQPYLKLLLEVLRGGE